MSCTAARDETVTSWIPGAAPQRAAVATQRHHRPLILVIEDNPADADLIREVLADGPYDSELLTVSDGRSALEFLHREPSAVSGDEPDLILLDLNMPGLDGRAVLAMVKQDPALRHIPVVVFSSSAAPDDVLGAYRLHANCYVTKPVGLPQFMSTLRAIERFWIGTATVRPRLTTVA